MDTVYINNNTNTIINQDNIVSNDTDGIIVNNSNCWQLIPDKDIVKQNVYTGSFPEENAPVLHKQQKKKMTDDEIINDAYSDALVYDIGFKNFTICTRTPNKTSGIISKPISTDNISYFTVTGTISGDGAVEYYILDGSNETPILPEDTQDVIKERLFYNLNTNDITTRFPVDTIQGVDPILYQDGIISIREYQKIKPEEFAKYTYCLTYTAAGEVQKYVPSSNEIRLKVIIRQYGEEPVYVNDIMIHGYGGSVLWTSAVSG